MIPEIEPRKHFCNVQNNHVADNNLQWTRKFRQTKGMRVDCIISIVCNMEILIIQ